MSDKEIDEISGTETTGHEWDGIKELNTPMPRWWLWTFYGTIIWAAGYVVAYPAWPTISGVLGYSSRAELAKNLDNAKAAQVERLDLIATTDLVEIEANPELAGFARAGGASAFKVYCSQCHGSGAAGAKGYPNLNDDEWIWGGTIEEIYYTIAHGARHDEDPDTHINDMPAFGADELLASADIEAVSHYVVSLSGGEVDSIMAGEGEQIYADNCASCHGEMGEGVAELGGPPLNNAIWLYGDGSVEAVIAQINRPQQGHMPAWNDKLGEATVKQLAVYVHSLGGGQ